MYILNSLIDIQGSYMTLDTNTQAQVAQTEAPKANSAEINLAQMRKMLEQERAEKERLKMEKQQLEQERERFARGSKREEDEDDDMGSEPYIDPKTLNRKLSKLESKFESIVERKAEEKARGMIEAEKRDAYLKQNADFDQMMQPDVIQKFAEKCPGMAEAILKMPEGFDRQRLVYEAIKNTGVTKKDEPQQSVQQKIDSNRRSPYYSPSGVGSAPYASAGDYSPAGQKNAYTKLQELKGRLRLG